MSKLGHLVIGLLLAFKIRIQRAKLIQDIQNEILA